MSIFPTRILLATDGSEDADLALRTAVDVAEKTGSELHVVHAWHSVPSTRFEPYIRAQLKKEAQELLAEQVGYIKAKGDDAARAHLMEGPAADEIVDLAEELGADLVVIGSQGMGSVGSLLVGSVSEGVVHHAPCPVLVVRGGQEAWPPQRIVIGDDGSEPAKKAGELGAVIAKLFGTDTVLVRAHENPFEPITGWSTKNRRELDEALLREERALEERAKELQAIAGSQLESRLIETEPTLAMLLVAEEEDEPEKTLLAVGSRGFDAAKRVMLGSVSTKILRVARGPVLICPP
jgi:nucleotide-binding universal stress UspA family protein